MPKVSEFYGISVYFYYLDHGPPHFHAVHAGEEVVIVIEDLSVRAGRISPRAMGLVIEWAFQHRPDLRRAWEEARAQLPLSPIKPLG